MSAGTVALAAPGGRVLAALRPRPVPWPTVVALAALMAYADGFVLVAIQGAVGAIERAQSPFANWLLWSTLLVPVHVLAVLVALAFARRRLGALRTGRRVVAAALLVAVAGTLVAFGAVVASAVYDYHLQSELLATSGHVRHGHEHDTATGACTGLCAALEQTRTVDERAVRYATLTDLAVNLVVVSWVLALRGGRLEIPKRRAL